MEARPLRFPFEFGLTHLPLEPGLIILRGPRQYGKSTWLDVQLRNTVQEFGAGSAYSLNGDELTSWQSLADAMRLLHSAFSPTARVHRLFIDEVTAVPEWQRAVKLLWDEGLFRDVLIITTGSKASDLRHGSERLPGRKGRLNRTEYVILPVSYRAFHERAAEKFGDDTWKAYLISGGSPIACNDLWESGRLPEYFIQLMRDWIFGEMVATGRGRIALTNILHALFRFGGTPVGYAKLARESGLANNTVAAGYIEQLADLLVLLPAWSWDAGKNLLQLRKPCKFQFINMAAVVALHPSAVRTIADFDGLHPQQQGMWMEWLAMQEVWRRSALINAQDAESLGFWRSSTHEIDIVTPDRQLIEAKRGRTGPLDVAWFSQQFPGKELTVICDAPFTSRQCRGITWESFLLGR